ncbi:calcium-binding protein [Paracoccus siganidrum]|nr:calcium-binding protein [Paracoccus siganidrum]
MMWTEYDLHLMSWWLIFGLAVALGFALQDDDDSPAGGSPFDGLDDFDPADFDAAVIGTDGDDVLTAEENTPSAMAGLGGDDSITGSRDSDYILGGAGNDTIFGRVGIDTIRAGAGDDYAHGGLGTDYIYGGSGDDTLDGGGNNDLLYGEAGDDLLIGGLGPDLLVGGAGNDTLSGLFEGRASAANAGQAANDGPDTLLGGEGDDELWLGMGDFGEGGAGADHFIADHRGSHDDGIRTVTDFNRDEDMLTLLIDEPAEGAPLPEITQEVSEDGADRLVLADGVAVLRLVGAGEGDPVEIALTTEPPAAA